MQMVHFLKPGESLQLHREIYLWVELGGRLIVVMLPRLSISVY